MEHISVTIEGHPYYVIGDEFRIMLEQVKGISGRAYRDGMRWHLPLSLNEARVRLAPLQFVDENELLDAEIVDIQRVQKYLLEKRPEIERRITSLDQEISRYSFRSKSSIKGGMMTKSGRLTHVLNYAILSVEELTEPQIRTFYAVLQDLEN